MCKLTKNLPIPRCCIFRIQGGGFDKGEGKNFRGPWVETPVGAMLWDNCNRVFILYYVHIPDPTIKLLVSVIQ